MTRTVGIGIQSFEKIIANNCFYIDKTHFIKEWWENQDHVFLLNSEKLLDPEKEMIKKNMEEADPVMALNQLSRYLFRHYGKKVIILLDEYDTPLQEAYDHGFWKELIAFIKNIFHSTFKTKHLRHLAISILEIIHQSQSRSVFSWFCIRVYSRIG